MKKASAITLSIIIMMLMLAALLGYTAFYIDQVTLKPVVLMQDTEVSLRCFFILSNVVGNEYLRDGEVPESNTLRERLVVQTYAVQGQPQDYFGEHVEPFYDILESLFGNSEFATAQKNVFWTTVQQRNLPVSCYMNVFGPVRMGTTGLFTGLESGVSVSESIAEIRAIIDPSYNSKEGIEQQ